MRRHRAIDREDLRCCDCRKVVTIRTYSHCRSECARATSTERFAWLEYNPNSFHVSISKVNIHGSLESFDIFDVHNEYEKKEYISR